MNVPAWASCLGGSFFVFGPKLGDKCPITVLLKPAQKWHNRGMKSIWRKYNPNPVGNRTEDCAQRAISAALNVDWDTASDIIYEMAKAMGTTTNDDAAWGAVLRRAGFRRAVVPNTCPDCFTIADFCRKYPVGVYVAKTSGHVVCIVDGQAWDTWDSTGETVSYFWYLPEGA